MSRILRPITAGLVTIAITMLMAAIVLTVQRLPWRIQEQLVLTLVTVPLGFLVSCAALIFHRRQAAWSAGRKILNAVVGGLVLGVTWASAVHYLTHGWVAAFELPLLGSWSAGAVVGLLVGLLW